MPMESSLSPRSGSEVDSAPPKTSEDAEQLVFQVLEKTIFDQTEYLEDAAIFLSLSYSSRVASSALFNAYARHTSVPKFDKVD